MSATKWTLGIVLAGLLALTVGQALAADEGGGAAAPGAAAGGNAGGGGRRGGGMRFDPAAQLESIKKSLGVTDEEWTALKPAVEAVQKLRMSRFGGMRRPGGDTTAEKTDLQKKTEELRATLDNKDSKPDEIKAKLAALREVREKSKTDLAKAQAALKELLTQRQEAEMALQGMLE